jgi:hypothetical protein
MNNKFDTEFKLYLNAKGINIDPNIFSVKFQVPQNFAAYRQTELDGQRINTFTTLAEVPYISKRFALKRFLGLSQEEMAENQELWEEENLNKGEEISSSAELRSAGITAGGIGGDIDALGESDTGEDTMPPEDMAGMGDDASNGMPPPAPAGGGAPQQ